MSSENSGRKPEDLRTCPSCGSGADVLEIAYYKIDGDTLSGVLDPGDGSGVFAHVECPCCGLRGPSECMCRHCERHRAGRGFGTAEDETRARWNALPRQSQEAAQ